MSDLDTTNPVVEPEVKADVSPLAEDTTPAPDVQVPSEEVVEEVKPHPLEPGGDRFKQVVAARHKEKERAERFQAELQREREERIRLEERLKVQDEVKTQPAYTEEQLEQGIDEGKWTRAQVNEYRKITLKAELKKEFERERVRESKDSKVLGELEQYKQLIPDVTVIGSTDRQKYEREFSYLVNNGAPDNYVTQLAAARAAFGDPDTIKARKTAKTVLTSKEPFMETHSPQNVKTNVKDFASTLSPDKKAHYEKMLRGGVYKDWAEIEAEEKWTPKTIRVSR